MVDIAGLPTPKAIVAVDYEATLAAYKTRLLSLNPFLLRAVNLEQSPTNVILETEAYADMLIQQRINAVYRALRLAYATGSDLDGLAADRGVLRWTLPATDLTPALTESDDSLQLRTWLRMQTWGSGSPLGVEYWARTIGLQNVADVHVVDHPGEGRMTCVVLPAVGVSASDAEATRAAIGKAVMDRSRRPGAVYIDTVLAEIVTVDYAGVIQITPSTSAVVALVNAKAGLTSYLAERRAIGRLVSLSDMEANQFSYGVVNVLASQPTADIIVTAYQASQAGTINISAVIIDG